MMAFPSHRIGDGRLCKVGGTQHTHTCTHAHTHTIIHLATGSFVNISLVQRLEVQPASRAGQLAHYSRVLVYKLIVRSTVERLPSLVIITLAMVAVHKFRGGKTRDASPRSPGNISLAPRKTATLIDCLRFIHRLSQLFINLLQPFALRYIKSSRP